MDEVILDNEVQTENLINYGEEGKTPNNPIEGDTLILSPSETNELLTSSNDNQVIAPDAISIVPVEEISTPSETGTMESASDNIDNSEHNIDDLYTLLNSGEVSVKLQSESETEILQSEHESEFTISDILNKLDENILLESEAYQAINDNIVKSNNNNNIFGFIIVSILASILGGLVAIGFLKGLR